MPSIRRWMLLASLSVALLSGIPACTTDEGVAADDAGESADVGEPTDSEVPNDVAIERDAADDSNTSDDSSAPSDTSVDSAVDIETGADTETSDTDAAPGVDTGDTDTGDGVDSGDSDALGDADVVDPGGDGLPFGPEPALAEVLAYLESGPADAVRRIANSRGWPLAVSGGTLFVNLDLSLTDIAGDFGGWEPTPMTAADGFLWYLHVDVRPGQRYKFTDGERYVADPWSRALEWDEFGEMSLMPPSYAHVQRYFGLSDGVVSARNLHVWVPAEPVTHVLYAHDGQNLFGPGSMFGSWRMEESAPAGVLIVGVFNTADRFDDYTPVTDRVGGSVVGGGADDYLRFLDTTIRPLVRTTYGEPGPVGILGSSLGGVVSLYAAVAQPGEWDFAASLSGALSWGSREESNQTLHASADELAASGAVIYLDSGGGAEACADTDGDGVFDDDPTERDDYCVTIQLRDQLAAAGLEFSSTLWHWWEPGALHNEAAWAARVERPLLVFADLP